MKKIFLLFVSVVIVSQIGCAKTLRYSADEIRDFPPPIQEKIKNKEISVGMTRLQVRYSWGGPDQVIPLAPTEDGKERVQWLYKSMFFKSRLVFTGDKLTEIISSEPGAIK